MLDDTTPIIGATALGPRRVERFVAVLRNTAAPHTLPKVERRLIPVSIDSVPDAMVCRERWCDAVLAIMAAHRHDPYFHFQVPAADIADLLHAGKDAT